MHCSKNVWKSAGKATVETPEYCRSLHPGVAGEGAPIASDAPPYAPTRLPLSVVAS